MYLSVSEQWWWLHLFLFPCVSAVEAALADAEHKQVAYKKEWPT